MNFVDAAIPGVIGLLLVANPRSWVKPSGNSMADAANVRKLRGIGWCLLGLAGLYLVAKFLFVGGGTA